MNVEQKSKLIEQLDNLDSGFEKLFEQTKLNWFFNGFPHSTLHKCTAKREDNFTTYFSFRCKFIGRIKKFKHPTILEG